MTHYRIRKLLIYYSKKSKDRNTYRLKGKHDTSLLKYHFKTKKISVNKKTEIENVRTAQVEA